MIPRLTELEPATDTTRRYLAELGRRGFSGDRADDLATRVVGSICRRSHLPLPSFLAIARAAAQYESFGKSAAAISNSPGKYFLSTSGGEIPVSNAARYSTRLGNGSGSGFWFGSSANRITSSITSWTRSASSGRPANILRSSIRSPGLNGTPGVPSLRRASRLKLSVASAQRSATEPAAYLALYAVTLAVNVACHRGVLALAGDRAAVAAFLVATGVTTVLNFVGMKLVTFRRGIQARRDGAVAVEQRRAA